MTLRNTNLMPELEIVRAYVLVQLYADGVIPRFGIETFEFHALYRMRGEAPMTQAELGRRLLRDPMNVSRIVRGLEARGLVQRTQSTTDARARLVALTPKAVALVDDVIDALQANNPTRGWSEEDLRTFTALLRRAATSYRETCDRLGISPERTEVPVNKAEGVKDERRLDEPKRRVGRPKVKEPLSRIEKRRRR